MKKQNQTLHVPVFSDSVFRILAEKSPNMIFINQNGRIIFANEKCEEIMGYKRSEFYSDDFDFTALIHPESRCLVKDNFMKQMRGEEVAPYEYKIITKDARELTAIHTTKLIEHEGEKAILGIITDITARKQAEEAVLRIAETVSATSDRNFFYSVAEELVGLLKSDYAYVAEVLPDSPERARTLSLIADGKVIDNVEVVLSGTPCSTLSGKKTCSYPSNVQELFPDAPMMAKLKVQGYAGTALYNSSGKQLGLMAVMFRNPIRNVTMAESILQIFGAHVSAELERKQAKEQIMRSKKEFEILMENALVGIFKTNLKGEILLSNRTLLNMFDFTSPDEMTTLPVFTDRKISKDRNEIIKKLKQTGKVVNFELNAVTHNGRSINILLNATLEDNIISGMMLDITKRKTAEKALITSERKFRTLYNQASDSIFLLSFKSVEI